MNVNDCAKLLLTHENILIVTHRNPDGDTAGSAAALCSALRRGGRTAWLFPNEQFGRKLMPWCGKFFAPEGFRPKYIVSVDTADEKLLCQGFEGKVDLSIDHHPSNTHYARAYWVDPEKASCAELVLELIEAIDAGLTQEEATLLYIALSTDTGCFLYDNTNAAAHRAAAELMAYGADSVAVNTQFFRKVRPSRIRLESMIYEGMLFYREGKIAVASVTLDMLARSGAAEDDLDDLAGLAGRCEGSVLSITLREKDDGTCRVSLRSNDEVDSCKICAVFGGGGHKKAAGCTISGTPDRVREKLLRVVDEVWQ